MPTYKIAGKIQKVEYKTDKTNLKVFSLTLAPDQNYFLKDDAHNFAVLVPGDEKSSQALAVSCKKEICFKFAGLKSNAVLEPGKRVELELEEKTADTNGEGNKQEGEDKQEDGGMTVTICSDLSDSNKSAVSKNFTLVSISLLA